MKSQTQTFTELYHALKEDMGTQYPAIVEDLERDLSRLQSSLRDEGLSFITITHPAMCDFFQKSLALEGMHSLSLESRPRGFGRKSKDDQRPRYLHGLLALIFKEDGTLRPDPDVTAIYFVRQWLLMAKKMEMTCDDHRTEAALNEFLAIEAGMPDHHPGTWDLDDPDFTRRVGHPLWGTPSRSDTDLFGSVAEDDGVDWKLYRSICDRFASAIGTMDPWSIRPKHGPGAVADPSGSLKYNFNYWPRKLQQYFPWDFFATPDLGLFSHEEGKEPEEREFPSVVLCVPKTQKGPRIICKEPIAHQWIQGGIQRFLEERVRDTFIGQSIDFRNQAYSQAWALDASAYGDLATVDLSAASDRISTRLVEYLFGRDLDNSVLYALHASRSRYFRLGDGTYRFKKFAPMGSACTFPVQSILFASFAALAICQSRRWGASRVDSALSEIRVFGDDIILPKDAIEVLYRALHSCGLKVNENKSYYTGLFRESCGMDAYAGVDITPAYVRRLYSSSSSSSLQAVVDSSNNLFMRGFWNTSACLLKTIPMAERKLLTIGSKDDGAVSLYSFQGKKTDHLRSKWNEYLQRYEVEAMVVLSRTTKAEGDGKAGLIQFFSEEPDPMSKYSSGQVRQVTTTKRRGRVSA